MNIEDNFSVEFDTIAKHDNDSFEIKKVKQLYLKVESDCEKKLSYTINVIAKDMAGLISNEGAKKIIIPIAPYPVNPSKINVEMSQNLENGDIPLYKKDIPVRAIKIVDCYENYKVEKSLENQKYKANYTITLEKDYSNNDHFKVNEKNELVLTKEVDCTKIKEYKTKFTVTNSGGRSLTTEVIIPILSKPTGPGDIQFIRDKKYEIIPEFKKDLVIGIIKIMDCNIGAENTIELIEKEGDGSKFKLETKKDEDGKVTEHQLILKDEVNCTKKQKYDIKFKAINIKSKDK